MIPLPPGVIPPNFLPGAPPPNTPEGQHLMRSFIMDQQRAFQQQMGGAGGGGGHNNNSSSFSFPLFPPGMSEEDIHEFMQDPENQGKIKVIMWHNIYRLITFFDVFKSIYLSHLSHLSIYPIYDIYTIYLCHHKGCD